MQEDTTLIVTDQLKGYLKETAKWGRFMAIVGFVFAGLILLAALGMTGVGMQSAVGFLSGGVLAVFYFVFGLLYLIPSFYLFKYATSLRRSLATQDQSELELAFQNLKSLFVFFGVATALGLIVYVLAIFAISAGGIIGSTM